MTAITTESRKDAARRLAAPALAQGFEPEALHTYRNAEGKEEYSRIRLKHPGTGEKWIRPMHANGNGYQLGEPKFEGAKPHQYPHLGESSGVQRTPLFFSSSPRVRATAHRRRPTCK